MPRRLVSSPVSHGLRAIRFSRLPHAAVLALLAAASIAAPTIALAACVSPAGAEGEIIYNDDFNVAQFCNGTSWVSMSGGASAGAESDPQVGITTLNKWCRGDGSSVVCDLNAPLTTESDPKIGTLTSGKYCTTNGTTVDCASDLPIGSLTNGKWCTTNGTTISCTTDAPAAGGTPGGADTQVQFNDGGAFGGDASFVWDKTNNRLGIGNTPSTELEVTGTVKSSGPFWSAFGAAGTHRGLLLENFDNTAVTQGVDIAAKLGGTEFQGLNWVKETAWLSGDVAANKDVMLQLGVLTDNVATIPMVIKSNGNVGVGTTNPGRLLTLSLNGQPALAFEDQRTGAGVGSHYAGFVYDGGTALTSPGLVFQDLTDSGGFTANRLAFFKNGSVNFGSATAPTTAGQVVFTGGNVGIGTTTPSNKLDIQGASGGLMRVQATAGDAIMTVDASGNPYVILSKASTAKWGLISGYAGTDKFSIYSYTGTPGNHLTIQPDGSVGVGTANPSVPLHVKRDQTATTELLVDNTGTAGASTVAAVSVGEAGIGYGTMRRYRDGSGVVEVGNLQNAALHLLTANTRQLTILGNGNVGIGTTSPGVNRLNVAFSGLGAVTAGIALNDTSASGSGVVFARFQANGTTIGSVTQSTASSVAYNTTSDRRLKKDIAPTQRGLADLMKIEVDDFQFTSDPENNRVQGFIAQQLREVYPEAVTAGGEDAQTRPWAVDYGRITPLLVKSMQDMKAANDNLRAENAELRTGLMRLSREIEALKSSLSKNLIVEPSSDAAPARHSDSATQ